MTGPHLYDGTLQMFVATPRDPDPRQLRFLRWLAERGRLEHDVAGPSDGSLAASLHDEESPAWRRYHPSAS